ncbi:hypothetical protein AB0K52_22405 [Glycomyces sp. NPDC049804]|uniref:hypothetical protein n=1 Tax=Glycomyces sp. NPDC049804 TaxID=3154363 RepID=UPI00342E812F
MTIHQQALRGLEDAGYPTGTIGPAHAGLPGLDGREGQALIVRLLELDPVEVEQLATQVRTHTGGGVR